MLTQKQPDIIKNLTNASRFHLKYTKMPKLTLEFLRSFLNEGQVELQ